MSNKIVLWADRLRHRINLGIKYYLHIIRNGQPERCGKKSVSKFDWSGDGRTSYVCEEHLDMRKKMLQQMGSAMEFISLKANTKKLCQEQLAHAKNYQAEFIKEAQFLEKCF